MSSEVVLKVENVGKRYEIYEAPHHRLLQTLLRGKKQFYKEFWALKDISFKINKGECLGIIGRNGCGKSTLLQIIAGTLAPTLGSVSITGKVAALLELGSGFNPDFTGRENVYMNGAIMGFSRAEMKRKFDDVAAFADIGEFIDQPMKIYSSGMFVRLAFAAAISVDPDILIIDEALAVGDMNFQAKCMTALTRLREKGATVLFVSHDVGAVRSLCNRAVYLEHGGLKDVGVAADVAEHYVRVMREEMNEEHRRYARTSTGFPCDKQKDTVLPGGVSSAEYKAPEEFAKRVALFRYGTGEVKIAFVELLDLDNEPVSVVEFNQPLKVRVYFESFSERPVSVNMCVRDDKKNNIAGCGFPHVDQPYLMTRPGGRYVVEYVFRLPLQEGCYSMRVQITVPVIPNETAEFLDVVEDAVVFRINTWEKARVWSKTHLFSQFALKQFAGADV